MTKLNIPYRSQWASDAGKYPADCGPTCVAMVLNYKSVSISPDDVYKYIDFYTIKSEEEKRGRRGVTAVYELIGVLKNKQADPVHYRKYNNKTEALAGLQSDVKAGNASIALIKYAPWRETTNNLYDYGHFVVVTGYDSENVYINDPLFGLWVKPAEVGHHYAMSHDLFCDGWGGFTNGKNPNWVCFVTGSGVQPMPELTPLPETSLTVVPDPLASANTMPDVNRRIRALAAYRWAAPPDFSNQTAVQLWLDHIGDWGLQYAQHQVQSGDTLSGLAEHHYGQSNRWHAIRAYNNLQRDGLWVGETILIPLHGTTNAQGNPALPSDTINLAKGLDLEELVDPESPAHDYNSVANQTAGIGYMT